MSRNIFFSPWVGKYYGGKQCLFSKKILVLGDSHYCDECPECGKTKQNPDANCDFTKKIVEIYLGRSPRQPGTKDRWMGTFSSFINALRGESCTDDERGLVFDSIVFYNYLQESAGDNPNAASYYDHNDKKHRDAFDEVIEMHRPDVIFAWGNRLWDLLSDGHEMGETISMEGKAFDKYFSYKAGEAVTTVVGLQHPCWCFKRQHNHELMSKFLS